MKLDRRFQRGVAAVEMALILPAFVLILAMPLFFGRVFWHYTAAQKAAHDAARYMSSLPVNQIGSAANAAQAVAVAYAIADAEMADLNPGPAPISVTVQCDGIACDGLSVPSYVRVVIRIDMVDFIFGDLSLSVLGQNSLLLTSDVSLPYVAN